MLDFFSHDIFSTSLESRSPVRPNLHLLDEFLNISTTGILYQIILSAGAALCIMRYLAAPWPLP